MHKFRIIIYHECHLSEIQPPESMPFRLNFIVGRGLIQLEEDSPALKLVLKDKDQQNHLKTPKCQLSYMIRDSLSVVKTESPAKYD